MMRGKVVKEIRVRVKRGPEWRIMLRIPGTLDSSRKAGNGRYESENVL
jgi:hypothetical protein